MFKLVGSDPGPLVEDTGPLHAGDVPAGVHGGQLAATRHPPLTRRTRRLPHNNQKLGLQLIKGTGTQD